jgi:hypothetical protein
MLLLVIPENMVREAKKTMNFFVILKKFIHLQSKAITDHSQKGDFVDDLTQTNVISNENRILFSIFHKQKYLRRGKPFQEKLCINKFYKK